MIRKWFFAFALAGALGANCVSVFGAGEILSEEEAARHGLTRAWFSQVQVDPTRGGIADIVVDDGVLFVQTDQAVLQAIHAETGQVLWTQQVGDPRRPSLTPGVSGRMVAALNGSTLQILNRRNGKLLKKFELEGAPGSGPALSQHRVYVPMTSGMIVSYQLKPVKDPEQELGKLKKTPTPQEQAAKEEERLDSLRLDQAFVAPLTCQSLGRTLVQPLITRQTPDEEFLAWTTDKGYLYIGYVDRRDQKHLSLKYRLQTDAPIAAQPAYQPPGKGGGNSGSIFCASQDGFVHAIGERDGNHLWRISTSEPIVESPVVVGQRLFVVNQLGGMRSLETKTGNQVWESPGISRFLAASKTRLYTADRQGRLVVLDGATGSRLATVATGGMLPVKPMNIENDRVFLATKTGLVQCLHERDLSSPVVHYQRPKEVDLPAKPSSKEVAAADKAAEEAAGEGKPSGPRPSGAVATTTTTSKKSGSAKKKGSAKGGFGMGVPSDLEGGKSKKGKKGRGPGEEMGSGSMPPASMPGAGGKAKKGRVPKFGE